MKTLKTLQTPPRTRARGLTLTETALELIDQALRRRWEEMLSEFTDGKPRKLTIEAKSEILGLSAKTVKHLYARNPIDGVTLRTTFEKLNIIPPFSKDVHCAAADTPRAPTPCLGRDDDISQIMALLETHSLVTLTGAGGVGKTRLALRTAEEMKSRYSAGVWFVDLSSLTDPDLVPQRIASVLGIREAKDRPILQALREFLRDKPLLLILDSCEHLLEACALTANAILADSSVLRIVATSRERLNIRFERLYYVPSLEVPDTDWLSAPSQNGVEHLGHYSSVALFADRARFIRADFEITDTNARVIASICRRLDGIPLAIELAAGRVGAMSLDDLEKGLSSSFDILVDSMAAISRHRTLEATNEWSYRLLREEEKTLLRRLSVFADGFSREAAEVVCGFEPLRERDMLNLLSGLIDKCLLRYAERDGISRYIVPEIVRRYAARLLAEQTEEKNLVRSLHRAHCLALAEIANPKLAGKDQGEWTKRLEIEHDNFCAALASSLADGDARAGMALCNVLCDFWQLAGHVSEGRSWCEKMLDAFSGETHDPKYTKVLSAAGQLAQVHGDLDVAAAHYDLVLARAGETNDRSAIAKATGRLAQIAATRGDIQTARQYMDESLLLFHEIGDQLCVAAVQLDLGNLVISQGDFAEARSCYEEVRSIFQRMDNLNGLVAAFGGLGLVCRGLGDIVTARRYYERGLVIARQICNKRFIAGLLNNLGLIDTAEENFAGAYTCLEESLQMYEEIGDRNGIASLQRDLGNLAILQHDYLLAQDYYERALALSQTIGNQWDIAVSLINLGSIAVALRDFIRARRLLSESLTLFIAVEDRRGIAYSLEAFAGLWPGTERAAALYGAGDAIREEIASPLAANEQTQQDAIIAELRVTLGAEAFASSWERGFAMPQSDAITFAFAGDN